MASSSLSAGFHSLSPLHKHKIVNKFPSVRSQSFRDDQGKSADMVDANLSVLKKRIEEVKKEKLMINNSNGPSTDGKLKNGWNYQHSYDQKHKKHDILSESVEMVGLVIGAIGFVFLSGTFFIYLVSFLVSLSTGS